MLLLPLSDGRSLSYTLHFSPFLAISRHFSSFLAKRYFLLSCLQRQLMQSSSGVHAQMVILHFRSWETASELLALMMQDDCRLEPVLVGTDSIRDWYRTTFWFEEGDLASPLPTVRLTYISALRFILKKRKENYSAMKVSKIFFPSKIVLKVG